MDKVKSITNTGLFAAIHVIFVLLCKFIPGLELILVIFLPLASAVYITKNDSKSSLMFIIATTILCWLFDPANTILYVIPALIVGIVYGILAKNKFKQDEIILITIFTELVSLVFSILLIKLFFIEYDLIDLLKETFNLTSYQLKVWLPIIALVIATSQAIAVHISIKAELKKMGTTFPPFTSFSKVFYWIFPITLLLNIIFSFLYKPVVAFTNVLMLATMTPIVIEGYQKIKKLPVFLTIQGFLLILCVFPLMSKLPLINYPILIVLLFLPIFLTSYIKSFRH